MDDVLVCFDRERRFQNKPPKIREIMKKYPGFYLLPVHHYKKNRYRGGNYLTLGGLPLQLGKTKPLKQIQCYAQCDEGQLIYFKLSPNTPFYSRVYVDGAKCEWMKVCLAGLQGVKKGYYYCKDFDILNVYIRNGIVVMPGQPHKGNWLTFLNVQVSCTRNRFHTKWYRKPGSKNIIVHFRSAHPPQPKRAKIKNTFRTAAAVSSYSDLKSVSLQMASRIAVSNGYPEQNLAKGHRAPVMAARHQSDNKIPFKVPFVSDDFSTEVRNCIRKAGLDSTVRMIEVPPANLKTRLVRNLLYDSCCKTRQCIICPFGKEGDCLVSGVVYLTKCTGCNGEYIGETGRPLGERVKEHLGMLRRCDIAGPLGEHRLRCHNGAGIDVAVTILAREFEISARKTLEAACR
ncbi:unnamed protein product [Heligmosomoides polygyrus]|uniref:GIY-YIG domain-containing protein n=1 Tax=Heligmosomoides polygyrus TaxID=6339 RepID=A0A183GHQ0_HELPZ|nr:unnamed protein product [Heligmosomoides polygyrus]